MHARLARPGWILWRSRVPMTYVGSAVIGAVTAVAAFLPAPLYGLTAVGWLLVFLAVVGHLTALQRFYYSMAALE